MNSSTHSRSTLTVLTILTGLGAVMAANSLVLGSQLMVDSRPFSTVASTPVHLAYYCTLLVLLGVLAQVLPHLGSVAGSTGQRFPSSILALAGVGVFLDAGTRFAEAFVVPFIAARAPELLDTSPSSVLMGAMVTAWVVYLVGLVSLGIAAYRRRIFPRPAAVLLIVGGLSVPVVGPLSGLLIGPALAWGGNSARRRVASGPPAVSEVTVAV